MKQSDDNYIKILYRFYSEVLEQETVETMWAIEVDPEKGYYKLDSIPFYTKFLAVGDIVEAHYDKEEQAVVLEDIIEFSGHSTVQVVVMDTSVQTDELRDIFHNLGCSTEKQMERYFVIDVPVDKDYSPIRHVLTDLETKGTISYAEACLSEQHAC